MSTSWKRSSAVGTVVQPTLLFTTHHLPPPADIFWGARYGQIADPFGHSRSLAHPLPGQPR
jgi:hypothetical protein